MDGVFAFTFTGATRSLLALALAVAALSEGTEAPRPLIADPVQQVAVYHALSALSRGDTTPLTALDAESFLADVGITDPTDVRLVRRWTALLPQALARLDPDERQPVLATLESRWQIVTQGLAANDPRTLALALAFLPAPSAQACIRLAADRAFDRGQFRAYRAWADFLDEPQRRQVADQLGGFGPIIDSSLALPEPGPLVATASEPATPPAGIIIQWQQIPGWLLALDPLGTVRWQYQLGYGTEVTSGDGGAVLVDGEGVRFIDEHGVATALPPVPAQGRVLAVAGGAAWFQVAQRIHRWSPDEGLTTIDLEAETRTAPLVRGDESLWLTAEHVMLVRGSVVQARYRHQLPVDARWKLAWDSHSPLVIDPQGHAQRITDLTTAVHSFPRADIIAHLVRAGRAATALQLAAEDPALREAPATRPWLLRAHLVAIPPDPEAALVLATEPSEYGIVLGWAAATLGDSWPDALRRWGKNNPAVMIAPAGADPLIPPEQWRWRVQAGAWLRGENAPLRDGAAVMETAQSIPPPDMPSRRDDGVWTRSGATWSLSTDLQRTVLSHRATDGTEIWRRWWPAADFLVAPSRQFVVTPTAVLVIEGTHTMHVFAPDDGRSRGTFALGGRDLLGTDVRLTQDGRVAILHPLWLQNEVHLLGPEGWHTFPLPRRGLWLVPMAQTIFVGLDDGSIARFPADSTEFIPPDLTTNKAARTAPLTLPEGLYHSGSLWPWSPAGAPGETPMTTNGSPRK